MPWSRARRMSIAPRSITLREQAGVEEHHVQRDRDDDLVVLGLDLEPLRLERAKLRVRVVPGGDLDLELAVDGAVHPVPNRGELGGQRRVDVALVAGVRR